MGVEGRQESMNGLSRSPPASSITFFGYDKHEADEGVVGGATVTAVDADSHKAPTKRAAVEQFKMLNMLKELVR